MPRRQRWPPGAEGLLFAPYLAGERTPHADPNARGAFTGLSLRHDRGALSRATLEGVAYGLRDSLELLRALGVRPEVGRISGGGARSELWLRIVVGRARPAARAHGLRSRLRVRRSAPRGCARRRLRRRRRRPSRAASACASASSPDPDWVAAYEHGYGRYRLLYPALRPLEEPQ